MKSIVRNRFGYFELENKPSVEEIENYYKDLYYQIPKGSYKKEYSESEIKYINNKLKQKYILMNSILESGIEPKKFLDIGCGEGWSLQFYSSLGWDVTGLDYSLYGCRHFNIEQQKNVIEGDIYENVAELINENKKFDCIYLLNVLEHVLDPLELLKNCYKLLSEDGVFIVQVPNDFSIVQKDLLNSNMIDREFWISVPDHISYFNKDGLVNICNEAGFIKKKVMGDFPIDLNLYNDNTNYILNSNKGNDCHMSRVNIENLLSDISNEKTNRLYEALADMGIGRNIIAIFVK